MTELQFALIQLKLSLKALVMTHAEVEHSIDDDIPYALQKGRESLDRIQDAIIAYESYVPEAS